MKYVVILEIPSTGYMDCIGICDNAEQAYGMAYLALTNDIGDLDKEDYYISLPVEREGENGYIIGIYAKDYKMEARTVVTVLFCEEDGGGQ